MADYRSPQGDVISVHGSGGHSLIALGWELISGDEPETAEDPDSKTAPRRRSK